MWGRLDHRWPRILDQIADPLITTRTIVDARLCPMRAVCVAT
jgi:hypothetical protein